MEVMLMEMDIEQVAAEVHMIEAEVVVLEDTENLQEQHQVVIQFLH